jgi:phage shock protein E
LHLEVDRDNLLAQRLYAQLGYAKHDRYYFMLYDQIAGEPAMKLYRVLAIALLATVGATSADNATPNIAADKLIERLDKKDAQLLVLDVRTPEEFAAGHVPGAVNISHDQLPNRIAEITHAKDKDVVVYCRSGKRAAIAEDLLAAQGFKSVMHLEGDMLKWSEEQRAVEK